MRHQGCDVRRLLVALYPAAWRRRYGAEYRDLLGELPLSVGTAADVIRGAARERLRVVAAWAPAATSALLLSATPVLVFLFWASWNDMYRESDISGEWRAATATALLLALLGALWAGRRGRAATALGATLIAASALALCWQYNVGPLRWDVSVVPLQIAMTAYVAGLFGSIALFVRDVRREQGAAAAGATSGRQPGGPPVLR